MVDNEYFADKDKRRAFVAGLRELADFLDANPDVPAPRFSSEISVHLYGTDEQKVTAIVECARLMGVEPTLESDGHHLLARLSFGHVVYQVIGLSQQCKDDFDLQSRLGREAFERLRDRALSDEQDGECVDADEPPAALRQLAAAVIA